MATERELVSLYRYFAWADYMRTTFRESLHSKEAIPGIGDPRTFVTMSYWFGALYVVVEAWQEELDDVNDPRIDALLTNADYVDLLRRYRNAAFHYQPDYFHEKLLELMDAGSEVDEWIHDLHDAFRSRLGNWFETSGHRQKGHDNVKRIESIRDEITQKLKPMEGP